MSEPIAELRHVDRTFDGPLGIHDVDIQIHPGEIVAITGPSGSGKSTILNLLGLLDTPTAGELRLFGDIAPNPISRRATLLRRSRLGYLFQNFALIENESVVKNLEVALTYASGQRDHRSLIGAALERVGLTDYEARRVHSLSGGEQQRVAVARLLLKSCDLVLADEPTGSLDRDNRDIVLNLLAELHAQGKTLVIATHDRVVVDACSRWISLRGGRLVDSSDR